MVTYDHKGRSLDNTLPYKIMILVGRELGDERHEIVGIWKMRPVQELKVAQLYQHKYLEQSTEVRANLTAAAVMKRYGPQYGGHDITVDYNTIPENEIHFISNDGTILAKVVNVNPDPKHTVAHDELDDKIENWFVYHSPTLEFLPNLLAIREAGKAFAKVIAANTPISTDQTAAIRHVRDAVMTSNAAIACKGK